MMLIYVDLKRCRVNPYMASIFTGPMSSSLVELRILRNFVAREATPEERDSFLVKNYAHLNDKARGVFRAPRQLWQV